MPDPSQTVENSDKLSDSDEHNDLIDHSNDIKDNNDSSQAPLEEEKKAPEKPSKKSTTIDIKSLSHTHTQDLWCKEIDRLIEVGEYLANH